MDSLNTQWMKSVHWERKQPSVPDRWRMKCTASENRLRALIQASANTISRREKEMPSLNLHKIPRNEHHSHPPQPSSTTSRSFIPSALLEGRRSLALIRQIKSYLYQHIGRTCQVLPLSIQQKWSVIKGLTSARTPTKVTKKIFKKAETPRGLLGPNQVKS